MMVVLDDSDICEVTRRLEARLSEAGIGIEDLIVAATEARSEITRKEFGEEDARLVHKNEPMIQTKSYFSV